jgi:hypothetical protein
MQAFNLSGDDAVFADGCQVTDGSHPLGAKFTFQGTDAAQGEIGNQGDGDQHAGEQRQQ